MNNCTNIQKITGVLLLPKSFKNEDLQELLQSKQIDRVTKRGANVRYTLKGNIIKKRYLKR